MLATIATATKQRRIKLGRQHIRRIKAVICRSLADDQSHLNTAAAGGGQLPSVTECQRINDDGSERNEGAEGRRCTNNTAAPFVC